MAVKIADTLKTLSNTFPVAECIDIDVNINGTTKRLQKAIDDGEIGGGSDSTWNGTREEWEALSTEEKRKYEMVCFTDDYDDIGICGSDSTWTGTKEEWESLLTEEKVKYEVVYFTDDYDGSGICGSDSTWEGTLEEWEALSTEEKRKYEIVYLTNDYEESRLIDDSIISNKTTYSSTKIENSLDKKANVTDLTSHTSDTSIHITTSEKTKWNEVDNKVNKTDIVDNLTSTDTNKPLSANQGKILKGEVDLKANVTDLTSHTSDTSIHITTSEKTKWNEVDNKVNKTDIVDNLTSTDTNKPLSANQGKILKGEVDLKANKTEVVKKTDITTTIDSTSTDTQVPSASAIYHKSKNGITEILTNNDIIAYADTIGAQMVTDTVRIMNGINSPYGADNISNDFHYTIYNINNENFKRIVAYDVRKNDMYMIIKRNGTWSDWKRVCTTNVADVPVTNIAPSDTTTFINFKGNSNCNYCVKNGICYVSLWGVKIASTGGTIKPGVILPKCANNRAGVLMTGTGDATEHAFAFIIDTGELCFDVKDANTVLYGSFSYPVSES